MKAASWWRCCRVVMRIFFRGWRTGEGKRFARSSISRFCAIASRATVAVTAAGRIKSGVLALLRRRRREVEDYLIYWAVIYYIARKWSASARNGRFRWRQAFDLRRRSRPSPPGGAISGRPAGDPGIVAGGGFAVVEVLILPFLAQTFCGREPLGAGVDRSCPSRRMGGGPVAASPSH